MAMTCPADLDVATLRDEIQRAYRSRRHRSGAWVSSHRPSKHRPLDALNRRCSAGSRAGWRIRVGQRPERTRTRPVRLLRRNRPGNKSIQGHGDRGGTSSSSRRGIQRVTKTAVRRAAPSVRLGLRENIAQLSLLLLVNAFVGAMVGMERTILPLLAQAGVSACRSDRHPVLHRRVWRDEGGHELRCWTIRRPRRAQADSDRGLACCCSRAVPADVGADVDLGAGRERVSRY